jgi:hypothetical protein
VIGRCSSATTEDVVDEPFGPGLPRIRDWTAQHFDFTGYITGFDAGVPTDVEAMRAELGYHQDERICVVSVGGSGIGRSCSVVRSTRTPAAAARSPDCGWSSSPAPYRSAVAARHRRRRGAGVRPCLHRHLAVCDVALVQGGLTTTMELTAPTDPSCTSPSSTISSSGSTSTTACNATVRAG